jgi:hypothetical protein
MLDLFLKLVDRFIELRKVQRENDRAFYTDHVAPAFAAFEEIHNDYLTTLANYLDIIRSSKQKFDEHHPVLDQICKDSLATVHLRSKLIDANVANHGTVLYPFILATSRYFVRVCESPFLDSPEFQKDSSTIQMKNFTMVDICVPRCSIHYFILQIAHSDAPRATKKEYAQCVVNGVIRELQCSHHEVCEEFHKLKASLLAAK